tara:strand:+ start:982 stop:1755 length:774 start_codon:yes stop_codon:yes gene_type:complete
MPVASSSVALTGQEGSVLFSPGGTAWSLNDYSDFSSDSIAVPISHDYRVNDPVKFALVGSATIDTAINTTTTYYVVNVTSSAIKISATKNGTAITFNSDGGTGSANSSGSISIAFAEAEAVAQVREFGLSIERELLDVTTLPAGVAGVSKIAPFRKEQPGFASSSGTMTVFFTDNQLSLANRLIGNILLKNQEGAAVKLYVDAVDNGSGAIDDATSIFVDSDVVITGLELGVNPDDPTTAELSFSLTNPRSIFGTTF